MDPASQDDRSLVDAFLKTRSERAFRTLYRRCTPRLYAFARRLAGDEQETDELVQETWVRAVDSLPRFRWQSTLRTWLIGIAINCYRQSTRRRGNLQLVDSDDPLMRSDDPVLHATAEHVDLERAIAKLPNGYRQVLLLHDVEGYTHQEIGDLLGIDPGTSKSQLFRARRAMRAMLTEPPTRKAGGENGL